MKLDDFRQQNPAYADKTSWPDDKLATSLYKKYYSDKMSIGEFTKSVGLTNTLDDKMSNEQWQQKFDKLSEKDKMAYGASMEAKIKAGDSEGMEEPWVSPEAAMMPLGYGARALIGKVTGKAISAGMASWGLKKTATAVATSLAAEPIVGQTMEAVDDSMTEAGVPDLVKLPVNLATGIVTGTLAEAGIRSLSSSVKRALLAKGEQITPEAVFKYLKEIKVDDTGAEEVISDLIKQPTKPANMKEAVAAITKAKQAKGVSAEVPEIKTEDAIAPDAFKTEIPKAGEHLHGSVLGAGAGIGQDEEGNITIHPGLMLGGAIAGGFAAQQASKMIGGTRMPGIKGGVKHDIKVRREAARVLAEQEVDPKLIFRKTGLWQAEDGRWRHEIDDSKAVINMPKDLTDKTLGEVLDHPKLYEHYPQLKDVKMFDLTSAGVLGGFAKGDDPLTDIGMIGINKRRLKTNETLLHEVQHVVQFIEGHAGGGSPSLVLDLDYDQRMRSRYLKDLLKTASKEEAPALRKELKKNERLRERFGMKAQGDKIDEIEAKISSIDDEYNSAADKLLTHTPGSEEFNKLSNHVETLRLEADRLSEVRDIATEFHKSKAYDVYVNILGEREANFTGNLERMKMTEKLRAQSMPVFENSLLTAKFMAHSGVSATTAVTGGVYAGVDWEEFEETGTVNIDPDKMLKGMLIGASVGMGITTAPKLASHWSSFAKNKIVEPLKDIVNGAITNESVRYQFGMGRSEEVVAMTKEFKRQSELVLRKAVSLGQELNTIAPNSLSQKRLAKVLEGGITTNPTLAKKANQVHVMFKDLKEATRALNLSMYSRFDKLTRKQRTELRTIIKDPNTPVAEVQTAQSMLNNYYHTGSAKEYLPIFNPQVEGLTKADKSILVDEIKAMRKKSRFGNPEGDPLLEDQIAQLEILLKKGTKAKTTAGVITLDQGYSNMRQDLPASVTQAFNNTIGPAYRVAKGSAVQGLDVLKAQLLKDVESNPEWVWPKKGTGAGPTPANFTKLYGDEWGVLNGRRIRNDVLGDLQSVIDTRNGFERNMDKYLGYWKYGKAILNPATHARNAVSNAVLAYFGGVDPSDVGVYTKAASAIKNGREDKFFKEAEGWGLYNNTFIESDISAVRDELDQLRGASELATWIRKVASIPSTMYDQSERFFKTAVFIKQREGGATIDEAAKHAEKYLFNYQDIPPVVRHYKRWAAPFATYTYKAIPLLAETAIVKPWKVGAVFGSMYALTALAQSKLGVSDEEVAVDKDQVLMEKGIGQVLLPFKNDQGDKLYFDAEAFMPWSGVGDTWGQSRIGLGDWLPSHPLFTISAAIMSNKEAFTGKEITDKVLDSSAQVAGKYLEFAWKQIGPSLAPGGYGFDKLMTGFKNSILGQEEEDYAGRKKDLGGAVVSALMGIKLTPANQEKVDQFASIHLRQIQKAVSGQKSVILRKVKRKEITEEEADNQMQDLRALQMKIVEEQLKTLKQQ